MFAQASSHHLAATTDIQRSESKQAVRAAASKTKFDNLSMESNTNIDSDASTSADSDSNTNTATNNITSTSGTSARRRSNRARNIRRRSTCSDISSRRGSACDSHTSAPRNIVDREDATFVIDDYHMNILANMSPVKFINHWHIDSMFDATPLSKTHGDGDLHLRNTFRPEVHIWLKMKWVLIQTSQSTSE